MTSNELEEIIQFDIGGNIRAYAVPDEKRFILVGLTGKDVIELIWNLRSNSGLLAYENLLVVPDHHLKACMAALRWQIKNKALNTALGKCIILEQS